MASAHYFVAGWASTQDVDHHRHALAVNAFDIRDQTIPLLHRHDRSKIAGRIKSLEYRTNATGSGLWIEAVVDDPAACDAIRSGELTGFSVGLCNVQSYEIKGRDTPQFFAQINKATLQEISLVRNPANPACKIVTARPVASDTSNLDQTISTHFDLMIASVRNLQRAAETLSSHLKREL